MRREGAAPTGNATGPRRPLIAGARPNGAIFLWEGYDTYWSEQCPGLSLCRWLLYYNCDVERAQNDWAMFWTLEFKRRRRRRS